MSRGIESEGLRTIQSSKEGEVAPRVKVVLGEGAEGWVVLQPVGMEAESSSRY